MLKILINFVPRDESSMARKFKSRRTRRLREGDESADPQTVRAPSDTFTVIKENAAFKTYYESQGIMEPEELEAVFKSFQEPLCTTFRFTGSRHTAVDLRETMKSLYFPSLQDVKVDDVLVPLPQTIPWYDWFTNTKAFKLIYK